MRYTIPLFLALFTISCYWNHKEVAEESAALYAKKMVPGFTGVDCVNQDTDGDGYVSCSIATPSGIVAVDCVGAQSPWTFPKNTGCRPAKRMIR